MNLALKSLAKQLIAKNQHKAALDVLRKLPNNDIEARCVMGELLVGMLRYDEAVALFEACMALDPKSEHPHGVRARVMIRRVQRLLEQQG